VRRLLALALLLAGCAAPAPEPRTGAWHVELAVQGQVLPFNLELARDASGWQAWFVNGEERVAAEQVEVGGGRVRIAMPSFQMALEAELVGGALVGTLSVVKSDGPNRFALRAVPGAHRFSETLEPPAIDVGGTWAATFTEDGQAPYPAVAELVQQGAQVTGTFLTPKADHRYLAGEVRGRTLRLSAFDGYHVFLYRLTLTDDGRLVGDHWSAAGEHDALELRRDPAARLPDADALTALKPGFDRLAFEFPDLDGRPVSLDAFRDKVVVVTLAGSWCPNCRDEARFLAPLRERLKGRGLEVVSLQFEHAGGFAEAAAQVRVMRAAAGVGYPQLIAGTSDKQDAASRLPMLDGVQAYPTTLFLDRSGRVRRIHTGFSGPGTGAHYAALTASFEATIEQLLRE
jgi:thiol-disulfide isomerase/thioredoxin